MAEGNGHRLSGVCAKIEGVTHPSAIGYCHIATNLFKIGGRSNIRGCRDINAKHIFPTMGKLTSPEAEFCVGAIGGEGQDNDVIRLDISTTNIGE